MSHADTSNSNSGVLGCQSTLLLCVSPCWKFWFLIITLSMTLSRGRQHSREKTTAILMPLSPSSVGDNGLTFYWFFRVPRHAPQSCSSPSPSMPALTPVVLSKGKLKINKNKIKNNTLKKRKKKHFAHLCLPVVCSPHLFFSSVSLSRTWPPPHLSLQYPTVYLLLWAGVCDFISGHSVLMVPNRPMDSLCRSEKTALRGMHW